MAKDERKWAKNSMLLSALHKSKKKLGDAAAHSAIVRFFCGYDRLCQKVNESYFVSSARTAASTLKKKLRKSPKRVPGSEKLNQAEVGIFVPSTLHKSMKTRLSEWVEESVLLNQAKSFFNRLLLTPMISYGVFLFSFGLFTTIIQAMKFFVQGQSADAALDLFVGLALVLLSLFAMFKGYESIFDCLRVSRTGHQTLDSVFGLTGRPNCKEVAGGQANLLLFMVGMIGGLATWLVQPMKLVVFGLLLVLAISILFVPETGLALLFALFPFMGIFSHASTVCGIVMLYVGVCWLIKVAVGKRSFSVDLTDAVMLALLLLVLTTGWAGEENARHSALLYAAMMTGYLTASNLLRSKLWIRRCSDGLIASSFAVALVGLVQWIVGRTVSSVFDSVLILNCYLLAVFPLTMARMNTAERRGKFRYLPALAAQSLCLLAGGFKPALLVWLIELIGFSLLTLQKALPLLLTALLLIPIAACILPFFGELPALSLSDSGARISAWRDLGALVGKSPLSGIGMSDALLIEALPQGSGGANAALSSTYLRLAVQIGIPGLLLFIALTVIWYMAGISIIKGGLPDQREKSYTLAGLTTLTGMLVMGGFCYLWSDYRLLMLFWLMAGLFQAVRKYALAHECRKNDSEIPTENVQWVNLDLYFDSTGKPIGSDFQAAPLKREGKNK